MEEILLQVRLRQPLLLPPLLGLRVQQIPEHHLLPVQVPVDDTPRILPAGLAVDIPWPWVEHV
ncbi:hypothetical protein ANCCAN_02944 [Ancylostoma caninum]|uniref:Uncharacterized protein n=1 Tax=Ancylostoma caninum TaxID=29170 RepID=A0A368H2V6_ANCCA|nr:hypothetical protein ANCCAN_02944 [Ancylostoma caninum]